MRCKYIIKAMYSNSCFAKDSIERKCCNKAVINGLCTVHNKMVAHNGK